MTSKDLNIAYIQAAFSNEEMYLFNIGLKLVSRYINEKSDMVQLMICGWAGIQPLPRPMVCQPTDVYATLGPAQIWEVFSKYRKFYTQTSFFLKLLISFNYVTFYFPGSHFKQVTYIEYSNWQPSLQQKC